MKTFLDSVKDNSEKKYLQCGTFLKIRQITNSLNYNKYLQNESSFDI